MSPEYEDILSSVQVSEKFAFDSGKKNESNLSFEEIDTPIKGLKVLILSIDWEITPELLGKYQQEIKKLEGLWSQDKIALAFLRILGALGRYIKGRQAESHPEAIKLLYSVYNGLEKVIVSEDMNAAAKVKLVQAELAKYNAIRNTILQEKSPVTKETTPVAPVEDKSQVESSPKDESFEEREPSADNRDRQEPFTGLEEEVTPALANAATSQVSFSQQWNFQDQEQDSDLESRLVEFFGGDDDGFETGSGAGDIVGSEGVVPLVATEDEMSANTDLELDGQAESSIDIDPKPDSQHKEAVPITESNKQETLEPSDPQKPDILSDLFTQKPSSSADDLLLKMHLPIDNKGNKSEEATEGSEESEVFALDQTSASGLDETDQNEEISERLDSFFGDDDASSITEQQDLGQDGVVPLPPMQAESQDLVAEPELPAEGSEESEVFTFDQDSASELDLTDHDEEISERLDAFFGDDDASSITEQQDQLQDGVVPLQTLQSEEQRPEGELDSQLPETTGGDEETETVKALQTISRLQEIIVGIDGSISSVESDEFSNSLQQASQFAVGNKVGLMLIAALKSCFYSVRETNTVSSENTKRLVTFCELVGKVLSSSHTPPSSDLIAEICEEMREFIVFQEDTMHDLFTKR